MKIARLVAALFALTLLSACEIFEYGSEGRIAALAREGASLAFSATDLAVIDGTLKTHGNVRIVEVDVLSSDEVRVVTETYRSSPPIYYDFFEKRDGEWIARDGGIVQLSPLGGGGNRPKPSLPPPSATPVAEQPNVELAPATSETIAAVRLTLSQPESWSDMKGMRRSLDARTATLSKDEQAAVIVVRKSLMLFEDYFSGHPFKLTDEEHRSLMGGIHAYEDRFYSELQKIQQIRRLHPTDPRGWDGATNRARSAADLELDRFGLVFAPHNWEPNRPNALAVAFIAVLRAYGELLCTESYAQDQPPLAACVPLASNGITNATASAVLDGGSYVLTLSFSSGDKFLRLFIAIPQRRHRPNEIIQILNEQDASEKAILPDTPEGKRLHDLLLVAIASSGTFTGTKSICKLLDRVLTDPMLPWDEVYFAEKWE